MTPGAQIRGDGWTAFTRDGGWVLKFKVATKWVQHRIQKEIKSEARIRRYVHTFLGAEAAARKGRVTVALPSAGSSSPIHAGMTFRELAALWTGGELARRFPDHVRQKRSARSDRVRMGKHVLPHVGDRPVSDFVGPRGLELCDLVMQELPPLDVFSRDSRRQVAQTLHRLLAIAVYPLKLIPANPLPRGWLPKGSPAKARSYLYPAEDEALMRCTRVPLLTRLFYGFLAREGLRASEARELQILDIDFERGGCHLDDNKTDEPRTWALSDGVLAALRRYLEPHRPRARPNEFLFQDAGGRRPPGDSLAVAFRRDLKTAGVKRPQLFANNSKRKHIRGHDLRATFLTINLANSKTETWIADRTGHKSSQMIARYRRLARTHAELDLGPLAPLADVIPELADRPIGGVVAAPPTTQAIRTERSSVMPQPASDLDPTSKSVDPRDLN